MEKPNAKAINCLNCVHSHSDNEHMLHCKLYDKMVAENEVCADFTH